MSSIRRWYVYLISAISLQAVTWALISLLRFLLIPRLNAPRQAIAFSIAVILTGLPFFVVHWLWAQRLAAKATDERASTIRRLYLFGMMAGFLSPFIANAYDLLGTLLQAESTASRQAHGLTSSNAVLYHLLALLILAVLWSYHQRIANGDSEAVPETANATIVRRLYVLGFSAAGLTLTTTATNYLLLLIIMQFSSNVMGRTSPGLALTSEITRLLIGVPLWLVFWRWAQRLFYSLDRREQESALRKVYLYAAVFIGSLGSVTSATGILAGIFRRALSVTSQREGDIRRSLSAIVALGILWAYHASILRDDTTGAQEAPRQAAVRRLYFYLVAAVGLSALLVGLIGDISVIIRSLDVGFGSPLRTEVSWFTAAIIAGLPVWLLPWRQEQNRALETSPEGASARRSMVRKIYLYFFVFAATVTVLSGTMSIVYQLLNWLLVSNIPSLSDLGTWIAAVMIAVCVWLYHGFALRGDTRLFSQEQAQRLQELRLVVVDVVGTGFASSLVAALKEEAPDLELTPIVLPTADTEAPTHHEIANQLAQAGLIIGPWTIAVSGGVEGAVPPEIAQAVMNSPAQKLLVPTHSTGWEWAGVNRWDVESLVRQTIRAIKQIAAGQEVEPARRRERRQS